MTTIDTNMSLVMIDPNEPLELYDGTIIKGRLEWFLYAICCLDYGNLPTPLSRIEEWANALITNELPNMEPQSRAEEFFKAILTGDTSNLPTPQSRSEVLLDKLARGENDFTNVEKIQSRYEFLLAYLIKNGGGIGNIDYVLYKFQKEDETLYSTKQRPVKSAILKGQTLVNLVTNSELWEQNGGRIAFTEKGKVRIYFDSYIWSGGGIKGNLFKPSTKYTLIVRATNTCNFSIEIGHTNYTLNAFSPRNLSSLKLGAGESGELKVALTTTNTLTSETKVYNILACENPSDFDGDKFIDVELMILEGDYTNNYQDIPYFEGMASVKLPVLTTTGKNLFTGSISVGGLNITTGEEIINPNLLRSEFLDVLKNTTYTNNTNGDYRYFFYDENKIFIKTIKVNPFTTPNNCEYIRFHISSNEYTDQLQIEQGSVATSYEPYKSNILTTPEDLELRGFGKVKDTLDCLTGEKVERIGEIVLDGTQGFAQDITSGDFKRFRLYSSFASNIKIKGTIMCDKFVQIPDEDATREGIATGGSENYKLMLWVESSRLSTPDVAGLQAWLQQNPVTIQYERTTPIVKTVDLTVVDQNNQPTKLGTFENLTYVSLESAGLIPEVEMEVATRISEELASVSQLMDVMDDISTEQQQLETMVDEQSNNVNATLVATTEIFEETL